VFTVDERMKIHWDRLRTSNYRKYRGKWRI
jgi:hypothetical protein